MRRRFPFALTLLAMTALANSAWACSVCYGDPDSEMVRGAVMGVYVMVGVVGFMLACVAGTGLFWLHRGRRFAQTSESSSR